MATPSEDPQGPGWAEIGRALNKILRAVKTQAGAQATVSANILQAIQQLQKTQTDLINNLAAERERRYEQEIDDLEKRARIAEEEKARLEKLMHEKQAARVENKTTTDKMKAAVKAAQEEAKPPSPVDWKVVRTSVVTALAIALTWSLVTYAPEIGAAIKIIFGK